MGEPPGQLALFAAPIPGRGETTLPVAVHPEDVIDKFTDKASDICCWHSF